ncbi:MAG: hypothetical protein JRN27_03630 [Nitrososphaerota archaeon]|nr:hypothetical protein [Nitrososphaerota archaeon]MDG6974151.1 hypothetical protein [Nitrososphaerota archaeon]MDG6975171.1 hypothetical protein [Nitrososphaerota archaeon]MDG7010095.1 hypothetical protein [Nitrososphaerota archaeon]MDG7019467.1 hypothetical protein [Nitrososphaerota archaeon]
MSNPVPGVFPGYQFQASPTWYQYPDPVSPLRRYAGPSPDTGSVCATAVTLYSSDRKFWVNDIPSCSS